jgi:oligopeptide transport system permease protein
VVNEIIAVNAPISAKIGLMALVFQIVIGIFLGLVSGMNEGKWATISFASAWCWPSAFSFVFAALLQYFIGFKWHLTPIFGWGKWQNYILTVTAYALGGIASYTKYMRSSTISVFGEDYITTAKAKGCTKRRIVRRHVFRNSMIPIVTMTGPAIAGIFAGSFILEKMFAIPGLGAYYMKSVTNSDYTVILGLTAFFAMLYVASLIVVDIVYGFVDPRIRVAKAGKK